MDGLFVTGPNRAGKDSFIKNYEAALGYSVDIIRSFKPNIPYIKNEKKYLNFLYDFIIYHKRNNLPFAAIRNHIDCYVYGKIYRNYDILDDVLNFETKLLNNDVNINSVILLPNINDLIDREDGKSIFNGDVNLLQKELDLFIEYSKKSKLNTILININKENTSEVYKKYKDQINKLNKQKRES